MSQAEISSNEMWEMIEKLEQITSIAKASKFGIHTTFNEGLTSEEIANIFGGIALMIEPLTSRLYDIHEARERV